jgi:hypothetical protein
MRRLQKLNIRIGKISQWFTPSISACHRCQTTWYFVKGHSTRWTDERGHRHGTFPLCEKCWSELTPTERLPYYKELWDEWMQQAPDVCPDFALIAQAVRSGL